MLISLVLSSGLSLAGAPLVAPGINSSRVVPGHSVTTEEVAQKLSGVKTIYVGKIQGPQGEEFINSAVASLNRERQGQYRTAADVGASALGGLGAAASAATGIVAAGSGIIGAGLLADKAEGVVSAGSDKAAERLDGVDRHPDEGFGIVKDDPTFAEKVNATATKMADREGLIDNAAKVAGAVGVSQVETALSVGKDAAKVTAAFFRAGVEGNSRPYKGVKLPITAVSTGKGDATLSAKVNRNQLPDKNFVKEEKVPKKDEKGRIVRDDKGNIVYIIKEIPCIKRVVEVDIESALTLPNGTVIATASHSGKEEDEACGKKRMEQIKTPEELAGPHISSAGSVWGAKIQPQMDTLRLKFNPNGSTALAIDHILQNRHGPGMCLLQEALEQDKSDAYASYSQAVLLEAWGRYEDALPLYKAAETNDAFSKGRWDNGSGRIESRLSELKRMEIAYGMVAKETAFPYSESCPTIDRSNREPITKRVELLATAGGEEIRRMYEGELVRVLETEGKWTKVEQLDGSVGWVKAKRAFK